MGNRHLSSPGQEGTGQAARRDLEMKSQRNEKHMHFARIAWLCLPLTRYGRRWLHGTDSCKQTGVTAFMTRIVLVTRATWGRSGALLHWT